MKKTIITLIMSLFITSCVIDEVIETKQNEINEELVSKSVENEKPILNFNIINKAENVILNINKYNLEYNDTILLKDVNLNEKKDTLILNGELKNDSYSIYKGLMYIPLNQYYTNNIILFDGCPWYSKNGYKLLQSIQFDVTVNDQQNENVGI